MSNSTAANLPTSRTFQPEGLCKLLIRCDDASCKQLTKTSSSNVLLVSIINSCVFAHQFTPHTINTFGRCRHKRLMLGELPASKLEAALCVITSVVRTVLISDVSPPPPHPTPSVTRRRCSVPASASSASDCHMSLLLSTPS